MLDLGDLEDGLIAIAVCRCRDKKLELGLDQLASNSVGEKFQP